jgi:hypothetical protein
MSYAKQTLRVASRQTKYDANVTRGRCRRA